MSTKRKRLNIGIITVPMHKSGSSILSNLSEILYSLSYNLYIITGNVDAATIHSDCKNFHIYLIKHNTGANLFTRVIKYIYIHLKILYKLLKIVKKIDLLFFTLGGECLLLPILATKLLRKKVIIIVAASSATISEARKDPFSKPIKVLEKINYALSNRIILYSPKLVKEWDLEKYKNKIYIAHRHFLDFDKFKIKKQFDERENLVGYIGRLSEEKGVLNFVKAIPMVSGDRCEIKILIGGDGQLREEIEKNISKANLNDKIELTGWIPHDKLPDYLNELKLLVLPSYTEGLPNLMLEAMACGTPVLATPVGAIPDVIKDRKTGFIMKDNSLECIGENVERALNYPDLEGIVKNARKLVEEEFTYEAAVEKYRKILKKVQSI